MEIDVADYKETDMPNIEEDMKIAILTFSHAINRGAHMQCYALSRVLQNMGHQVKIIHIELPSKGLSWKGQLDRYLLNLQNKRFRKKYYPGISEVYRSADELRKNRPAADAFVVGSDQVWNPSITKAFGTEAFFLDFVPDGCKRIAYAASFGVSVWASVGKEKEEEIGRLLHKFDAVSVRELDAVDICKSIFNFPNALPVIDPVFLLDDYTSITGSDGRMADEVICYPLCTNEETKFVFRAVSAELNLIPISYSRSIRGGSTKVKLFSSIPNWLKAIRRSRMIVTNSFHCMAFCILFRKKFIVTPPFPGRESRMLSMLNRLGLESRYVRSIGDFLERKEELYAEIDYNDVNSRLSALRRESLIFLINSI